MCLIAKDKEKSNAKTAEVERMSSESVACDLPERIEKVLDKTLKILSSVDKKTNQQKITELLGGSL